MRGTRGVQVLNLFLCQSSLVCFSKFELKELGVWKSREEQGVSGEVVALGGGAEVFFCMQALQMCI